jgi:hypothetical protein
MRLRPFIVLLAAAALSACAGSAPIAEAPPVRPPAPRPPVVRPAPPEPVAAVPDPGAPAPASAPRGTVASRAYYPEADVTEWVLTNGATVVFKPLPNGGNVDLLALERLDASDGTGPRERVSANRSPRGEGLTYRFGALLPVGEAANTVYVVVGDATPGEIEAAAAPALVRGTRREDNRLPVPDDVFVMGGYRVSAPPESDAAVAVLVEILRARHGPSQVSAVRDEWAGTTTLFLGDRAGERPLARFRPTAAEVAAARSAARARLTAPTFWTAALADLYRTDGDLRPSRDPAFVAEFPARVARVSERAVTDLASRLAASPVTVTN